MWNSDRSRHPKKDKSLADTTRLWILQLFILTCSVQSLAQSQAQLDSFFAKFQSNFIQILDSRSEWLEEHNEDFPWFAAPLAWEWVGFNPEISPPYPNDCEVLQNKALMQSNDFLHALTQKIDQCAPQLRRAWPDPVSHVLGTVFLKLNLTRHPWVRWVEVRLPGGVRLKGLLGLKGDLKRRPFTVFRVGIFASASNYVGEKYLFTQLFEQGLGNFLLLENTSSADFIAHNQRLVMGGVEEGVQNFYISRRLQSASEPLSKLIGGVHLVGMSMGGAGVMYANILDQLNPPSALQSSMLYCPLLDMKASVEDKTSDPVTLFATNLWAKSRLRVTKFYWPELRQGNFIQNLLEKINEEFKKPLTEIPGMIFPGSAQVPNTDPNYFWKVSNWIRDYQNIQLPTLIVATAQDPAVPYHLNSGKIVSKEFPMTGSNLHVVTLDHGYHCTLTMAYNWKAQTQWQQAFLWNTNRVSKWAWLRKEFPLGTFTASLPDGPVESKFSIEGSDLIVDARLVPVRSGILEKVVESKAVRYKLPLAQLDAFVLPDILDSVAQEVLRRWIEQNVHTQIADKNFVITWPAIVQ